MLEKWLKRIKKDERGLTLVELLAVVVILAIVAAIAFILIGNVIENSKKDAHVSNALQLISAAKLYDATEGMMPGESVELSELQEAGYIGNLTNPWDDESDFTYGSGAVVTKQEENDVIIYNVQLDSPSSVGCNIDNSEDDLNNQGRDVCNTGNDD